MKLQAKIAAGLSCEFSYDPTRLMRIQCNWSPGRPDRLAGQARRRYEEARERFGQMVQQRLGQPLILVEGFGMSDQEQQALALQFAPPQGNA